MKLHCASLALLALWMTGGCPQPLSVIELSNQASETIRVRLYASDQQTVPEDVLIATGQVTEIDVLPGQTRVLTRSCLDLRSLLVQGELRVLDIVGQPAMSDTLRSGEDYRCGERLSFTFTEAGEPAALEITFDAS